MDRKKIEKIVKRIIGCNGTGHLELCSLVAEGEISSEEAAVVRLHVSVQKTVDALDQTLNSIP